MSAHPLRLLLAAYGLSAAAALVAATSGASVLEALLLFWLGGPAAVFGLAALPGLRPLFLRTRDEEAARLTDDLRQWDADLVADQAAAAPPADSARERA